MTQQFPLHRNCVDCKDMHYIIHVNTHVYMQTCLFTRINCKELFEILITWRSRRSDIMERNRRGVQAKILNTTRRLDTGGNCSCKLYPKGLEFTRCNKDGLT